MIEAIRKWLTRVNLKNGHLNKGNSYGSHCSLYLLKILSFCTYQNRSILKTSGPTWAAISSRRSSRIVSRRRPTTALSTTNVCSVALTSRLYRWSCILCQNTAILSLQTHHIPQVCNMAYYSCVSPCLQLNIMYGSVFLQFVCSFSGYQKISNLPDFSVILSVSVLAQLYQTPRMNNVEILGSNKATNLAISDYVLVFTRISIQEFFAMHVIITSF